MPFLLRSLLLLLAAYSSAYITPIHTRREFQFNRFRPFQPPRRIDSALWARKVARNEPLTTDKVTNFVDIENISLLPKLVLLSVPISWGTYTPVVKVLYSQPHPVPGVVFSTMYYAVAAVTLGFAKLYFERGNGDEGEKGEESLDEKNAKTTGGAELAGYLFVANIFQLVGLQSTSAIVAAFIVQLTTIFVPLIEGLRGGSVKGRTWASCTAAFVGVVMMTISQSTTTAGNVAFTSSQIAGDAMILVASVLYSFHVVRLGDISKSCSPLSLASSKASYELLYGSILILLSLFLSSFLPLPPPLSFTEFFKTSISSLLSSPPSLTPILLATLWTGLVTCAYTIFAQSFGQRSVTPSDANLIYTSQPVWSAVFAYLALGETLQPQGWVGAAIIFAALGLEINKPKAEEG